MSNDWKKIGKIGLLGPSFDTGNLGVSALAESSIKILLRRWPEAEIVLLGSGYEPERRCILIGDRRIDVLTVPIRFSKNIFLPYHFLSFFLCGLLMRLLPFERTKNIVKRWNRYAAALSEMDIVVDITGGDSFSDIYGFSRFLKGSLRKWLVLFYRHDLVLMPQTYGPFKGGVAKWIAKFILDRARLVYARDTASRDYVGNLLDIEPDGKLRLSADVAFVLDPRPIERLDDAVATAFSLDAALRIGVNVSGLLFYGGYTRDNMFGLKEDYSQVMQRLVAMLLEETDAVVLLVPHVFSRESQSEGRTVENDVAACRQICEKLAGMHGKRLFMVPGIYDENEIKYIIGRCDFFIGSRMHSCIAALSQCIPAVGLAYSRKFAGVFDSVGVGELVLDMRDLSENEILTNVRSILANLSQWRQHLLDTMPARKQEVLSLFERQ